MEAVLEAIFIKVVNMSITASYVILAVMALRLLLKKAPKKYAYALWGAVGFRLICPVSFRSVFSVLAPLRLDMKQVAGVASTIVHVPSDIGLMREPAITTGIPVLNSAVSASLPAPANELNSVNPMQVWLFVGMVLWCLGMAALVVWSVVSLLRLRRRLRTAVVLRDHVWQSEAVRSPFLLGLLRPRIYIPFGLERERLYYVLAHERCHLRRGDHVVRLLAFALVVVHWFNPLVWLAWFLMGRDMEMSCDERVLRSLSGAGAAYSETLLSFASPRRASPGPLAFGETAVKSRIQNALGWKAPRRWVTALAAVVCILAAAACAANPVDQKITAEPLAEGAYVSSRCLYMNPLSSTLSLGDTGRRYVVRDGAFTIETRLAKGVNTLITPDSWGWQTFPYSGEEWRALFWPGSLWAIEDLDYGEMLCQPLTEDLMLLQMDGILWLVELRDINKVGLNIWSIHTLVPEADMGSARWQYAIAVSAIRPAFPFTFDFETAGCSAVCVQTGLLDYDGGQEKDYDMIYAPGSRIWWWPHAADGTMVSEAKISFSVDLPDGGQYHGSIYITMDELRQSSGPGYTARLVADGLVMEQDEAWGGGVIKIAG